jgi:hypothetical protein
MANLLWKTKNSTKKLLSTPFQSEEEFETHFNNNISK